MKKVAIGVVVVAVLVALFFALRGGGEAPRMAEAVPAKAAALGGAQALDAVTRRWLPVARMVEPSLTPEKIQEQAGFDPTTAEGWQSIGIDPAAGIGVAIDARVVVGPEPVPLVLVRLNDVEKTLAWASARSGQPVTIEGEGAARRLKVGDQATPIGERAGWTVLLAAPPTVAEKAMAGFQAFLSDDGDTLDGAPIFADAFAGAGAPRVFWWGGSSAAGSLLAAFGAPEEITSTADFYASMFPSAAAWLGEADNGTRLVATEKGQGLVRKLFVPQRRNPKVARYIGGKGWGAVRFSANLTTVLDGVGEAIPPAAAQAKAAVGMVRMMLPMAAGVNWEDISAGLSGHVVLAGETTSMARVAAGGLPDALMLLGVNDEAKADVLIGKLLDRVKAKVPGASVADVEIGGEKGRTVAMGPMKVAVVRVDDVVLVGPEAAVGAALKRADGEHLEGSMADALDGDAMWAAVVDAGPLLAELDKQLAGDANARNPLEDPTMKPFVDDPRVAITAELDGKGILWRARAAVPLDVLAITAGAWFWTVNAEVTPAAAPPAVPAPAPAAVEAAPEAPR